MKYINTVTGNIIESAAKLSGGDWKPVRKESQKQMEDPKGKEDQESTGADSE